MSKESMMGAFHQKEIKRLCFKIMSNSPFLDQNDIKVLEFLSTKGDFENKTVILQEKDYVPFVSEVEQFNHIMGKPNNYEPTIPEQKEWEFVYNFILEELEEYREACQNGDIVEVLDALCDITYVATGNGTMLHGLKDKIWPAYQEVQASNLSKACKTEEEAKETAKNEAERIGEETYYEKIDNMWVVYRKSDKKVLKSINYFRPNLKQFFE
jgi:hypothetical protein